MHRLITCTVLDMKLLIIGGHKKFLLESPPKTKEDKDFLYEVLSISRKQGLIIFCVNSDEFQMYHHLLIQKQIHDKINLF
jgi:hypothetical protein